MVNPRLKACPDRNRDTARTLSFSTVMSTVSKACCVVLALVNALICFNHIKDPEASLRDFGVVGPISPIAKHCCAIIGTSGVSTTLMMLYAATAAASVRSALVVCYLVSMVASFLPQIWYPFNDPAPKFPTDMPYPLLLVFGLVGIVAVALNADDAPAKKKK